MKKQSKAWSRGLSCLILALSFCSLFSTYTTQAAFVDKASAVAGLELKLGNIDLNVQEISQEGTTASAVISNTGTLDGKLAYKIDVPNLEQHPQGQFFLKINETSIPLDNINEGNYQLIPFDNITALFMESGTSIKIKFHYEPDQEMEEHFGATLSLMLVQTNQEKVNRPDKLLFHDVDTINLKVAFQPEKVEAPNPEEFREVEAYPTDPEKTFTFQMRFYPHLYYVVMNDSSSTNTQERLLSSTNTVEVENPDPINQFSIEISSSIHTSQQQSSSGSGGSLTLTFKDTTVTNQGGNVLTIQGVSFPLKTFAREIALSSDIENKRFAEREIYTISGETTTVSLIYLPEGREATYNYELPTPAEVSIYSVEIIGEHAGYFKVNSINEQQFDIGEVGNAAGKTATLKITVKGQNKNGAGAIITRTITSQSPVYSATSTQLNEANSVNAVDETKESVKTNDTSVAAVQQSEVSAFSVATQEETKEEIEAETHLESSEYTNKQPETTTAEEQTTGEKVSEEQLDSGEDVALESSFIEAQETTRIAFQSVPELEGQSIGLPDFFWGWREKATQQPDLTFPVYVRTNIVSINEWLQSKKLEPITEESTSVPVLLDLSQAVGEDALDQTIKWLEQITQSKVEVLEMKEEYPVLVQIQFNE